jgi:hypothetical protein
MVGPLIGGAIRYGAKKLAQSSAKKKAKKNIHESLERRLRSENKGDARTAGRIKRLREQEEAGLISAGEHHRALNSMTKASKDFAKAVKRGKKIGGVRRTK